MQKHTQLLLALSSAVFVLFAPISAADSSQRGTDQVAQRRTGDSIKIVNSSPSTGAHLEVGEKVELIVHVDYALTSARSAKLALIVQKQKNGVQTQGPVWSAVSFVQAGERTAAFRTKLRIPKADSLHVFVALQPEGASRTSSVDHLEYRID